jgi:hypothetical protein
LKPEWNRRKQTGNLIQSMKHFVDILALPFQVSLIGVWIYKERLFEAVQAGC